LRIAVTRKRRITERAHGLTIDEFAPSINAL
jgi:hypothetical protein